MAEKRTKARATKRERTKRISRIAAVEKRQRERAKEFAKRQKRQFDLGIRLETSLRHPEPRRTSLMNAGVMRHIDSFESDYRRTDKLNRQDPVYRALLRQVTENSPTRVQDFFYKLRKRIIERKMTQAEYLDLAKMYLKPAEYEKVRKKVMSVRQTKPKVRTALKDLKKDMRARLSTRRRRGR